MIPRREFERPVQLVLPDGRIYSGAAAAAQALRRVRGLGWVWLAYRAPGVAPLAERSYRWVSARRSRL